MFWTKQQDNTNPTNYKSIHLNSNSITTMASTENNHHFKDVEEALEKFGGETGKEFQEWLVDFENISTLCKWNDIQKFLYCRRLLKGAARLGVEAEKDICSWEKLKNLLNKEFGKTETENVHKILQHTKKNSRETFLEYLYRLKLIAKRGTVNTTDLIDYIISVIQDNPLNKSGLYGAKDLEDLKDRFKGYEKMRHEQSNEKKQSNNGYGNCQSKRELKSKRCVNCGAFSHLQNDCPDKSKGSRCFKCNEFGRNASICKNNPKDDENKRTAKVKQIKLSDVSINTQINGKSYNALIDTGSDITIIKQKVMKDVEIKNYNGPGINVIGFGKSNRKALGTVLLTLCIDFENYEILCHVVPDHWLSYEVLLGKDFFKEACLLINGEKPVIYKIKENDPLISINIVENCKEDTIENLHQIRNLELKDKITKLVEAYIPDKPERSKVEMNITLENEVPIYQKPRRLAMREREIVKSQVSEWLKQNIIKPSHSDFASPIVLAKKRTVRHVYALTIESSIRK